MKLSKECIEAIEEASQIFLSPKIVAFGMEKALKNPSIYSKAGLISLEDAFAFLEWAAKSLWKYEINKGLWFISYSEKPITTAQLFQIYQEQKDKK